MKILALDQSSQVSGFSVFEDDILIDSGTFSVTGDVNKRLVKAKNKVNTLITKYQPDKVIIEDIQLEEKQIGNVHTFKILAQLQGALIILLEELNIDYDIVLASTWRSVLKIKGTERKVYKKNTQLYVQAHYDKTVSEDEADAICIGAHLSQNKKNPHDWTR